MCVREVAEGHDVPGKSDFPFARASTFSCRRMVSACLGCVSDPVCDLPLSRRFYEGALSSGGTSASAIGSTFMPVYEVLSNHGETHHGHR